MDIIIALISSMLSIFLLVWLFKFLSRVMNSLSDIAKTLKSMDNTLKRNYPEGEINNGK